MREQQTGVVSQTGNDNACKETYEQCQQGLVELHRLTGIPPSIKRLDGEVVRYGEYPVEKGPRSQVWIGYWLGNTKVGLVPMSKHVLVLILVVIGSSEGSARLCSVR